MSSRVDHPSGRILLFLSSLIGSKILLFTVSNHGTVCLSSIRCFDDLCNLFCFYLQTLSLRILDFFSVSQSRKKWYVHVSKLVHAWYCEGLKSILVQIMSAIASPQKDVAEGRAIILFMLLRCAPCTHSFILRAVIISSFVSLSFHHDTFSF
jgi:hypothetical protein